MSIPRVKPGDPIRAAMQNEIIDRVNRQSTPGGGIDGQFGSTGPDFTTGRPQDISLFEIVAADWTIPDPSTFTYYSSAVTVEQVPSITARRVDYGWHETSDVDTGSDPVHTYGTGENRNETIYHPTARFTPSSGTTPRAGYAVGPIGFGQGDRVWCLWNRQSGRWEILADSESNWLKVWNGSGTTIPARGIVALSPDSAYYCATLVGSVTQSLVFPGVRLAVVGPTEIPSGGYGLVSLAERPTLALYDSSICTGAAGDEVGPSTSGYSLHSGLPGFRYLGSVSGDSTLAWVIRDRQAVCRGVATERAYGGDTEIRIRPISCTGSVYDGSSLPAITPIYCFFPGKIDSRDLNIQVDDTIYYRAWPPTRSGFWPTIAYGDYWDDAMGTIRMMTAGSTIPRGWRRYTSLDDRFPRGGTSSGTGGTTSHTRHVSRNDTGGRQRLDHRRGRSSPALCEGFVYRAVFVAWEVAKDNSRGGGN